MELKEFGTFLEAVDPDLFERLVDNDFLNPEEDWNTINLLKQRFNQNKEDLDRGAGFGFDRNKLEANLANTTRSVGDLDLQMKSNLNEDGTEKSFFERMVGSLAGVGGGARNPGIGAAGAQAINPYLLDTADFLAETAEHPRLAPKALGNIGKVVVDYGSGFAAAVPRTLGFDKTEKGENKTAKVLSSLLPNFLNVNKAADDDTSYGMTLLDSIIGEEGLISPPKSVEAATGQWQELTLEVD